MQFIRFSDLCANGQAKDKRVFIRADLNVPQDDEGNITEDTRIRAARLSLGLTQSQAGALVGVTDRAWRYWETGKRKMPSGMWELFVLKTQRS